MKYYCNECKEIFDEDEALSYKDDPSPVGVGLPEGSYTYLLCPHCKSDDIEEAEACPLCGEYHNPNEDELCEECKQYLDTCFSNMIQGIEEVTHKGYTTIKEIFLDHNARS